MIDINGSSVFDDYRKKIDDLSIAEVEKMHKLYLVTFKDTYRRFLKIFVPTLSGKVKYSDFDVEEKKLKNETNVSRLHLFIMSLIAIRIYYDGNRSLLKV